jgi:hypothetical protein
MYHRFSCLDGRLKHIRRFLIVSKLWRRNVVQAEMELHFGLVRARHLHGLLRYSFPSRFPFPVFLDTLSNSERGDLTDQR